MAIDIVGVVCNMETFAKRPVSAFLERRPRDPIDRALAKYRPNARSAVMCRSSHSVDNFSVC